jgi:hypothetical protein
MFVMRTGRGFMVRRPTKPRVSTALANLRPGQSLVLERVEEEAGDWYIQVWMREGNSFQLEYRDGVPSEHFQTRTVSREKVITAILEWMKGTSEWQEPFMWNNIGSWFDGQDPAVSQNPDGTFTRPVGE